MLIRRSGRGRRIGRPEQPRKICVALESDHRVSQLVELLVVDSVRTDDAEVQKAARRDPVDRIADGLAVIAQRVCVCEEAIEAKIDAGAAQQLAHDDVTRPDQPLPIQPDVAAQGEEVQVAPRVIAALARQVVDRLALQPSNPLDQGRFKPVSEFRVVLDELAAVASPSSLGRVAFGDRRGEGAVFLDRAVAHNQRAAGLRRQSNAHTGFCSPIARRYSARTTGSETRVYLLVEAGEA